MSCNLPRPSASNYMSLFDTALVDAHFPIFRPEETSMIQVVVDPITGQENAIDPREPIGALAEFYRAFNTRDLALMEKNWASSDEVSMENTLGGIKRRWSEIRQSYEHIFGSRSAIRIELYDYTIHDLGETFLAVGRERGTLRIERHVIDLKIRTSRLFQLIGGRWRQFHHHGSVEDPELLARYQAAVH
jgi:hypothetical protein